MTVAPKQLLQQTAAAIFVFGSFSRPPLLNFESEKGLEFEVKPSWAESAKE